MNTPDPTARAIPTILNGPLCVFSAAAETLAVAADAEAEAMTLDMFVVGLLGSVLEE